MVLCETPGIIRINSIFLYMQITFWDISCVYIFLKNRFYEEVKFHKIIT